MEKLDKAQQLELEVLQRQKFMNAVIYEKNSPIQKFYEDTSIFLTGGAGFLGKQLIEKLLRACSVKKIYVLLRPKKDKTIHERLKDMLEDPVYDVVRQRQPNFASVLEAVEGDVAELRMGLTDKDWQRIAEEVDLVIHMAATVRFDGPLQAATVTNVRGTRECVTFAKSCKKLKCFTYVSTAFTHATESRIDTVLEEKFYPCTITPEDIIHMAETMDSKKIDEITPEIIKGWPNTYTFTKAIAEEVINTSARDLPVCVVKPPVVLPAYYEPTPGWADLSVMYGPSGITIGIGLGVLHVFSVEIDKKLNMVPVDYVNNAIITAPWDTCERRSKGTLPKDDIPILTISSSKRAIVWDFMSSVIRSDDCRRLASPLAVWYCYLIETANPFICWILTWFLHYIPAYMADGVCAVFGIKIKEIPSFRKFYQKVYKMSNVFGYFFRNEWFFADDNLSDMICRMSGKDRDIFNCDINTIDYGQYIKIMCIGLRKYIVKDGLKDSEKAYKRQRWLAVVHYVFMALYIYVLYYFMYLAYKTVEYIVF
ncbi:fatty acyl-CoA reductase wat-like [Anticarsia gemmatalis]|uniref:fatty acyl-CoA reductase wat-like n=1 Tax=Anticarsia gemmatalis TaxID=129554 RepID=UPI003F7746BD